MELNVSRGAEFFAGPRGRQERSPESIRLSGADLVVVLCPDAVQVDAAHRRAVMNRLHIDAADIDQDYLQRRLTAELEKNGIRVLDLLPAFRAAGSERALYRLRNTHWNREGNRLAAETLSDFLVIESLPRYHRIAGGAAASSRRSESRAPMMRDETR